MKKITFALLITFCLSVSAYEPQAANPDFEPKDNHTVTIYETMPGGLKKKCANKSSYRCEHEKQAGMDCIRLFCTRHENGDILYGIHCFRQSGT